MNRLIKHFIVYANYEKYGGINIKIKILYHIGNKIGSETIVKKGIINIDKNCIYIEGENEKIDLFELKVVEKIKLNHLGTMIKIINSSDTIFLTVPRLFINIGTGFAIINYFKTKKLKRLLHNYIQQK